METDNHRLCVKHGIEIYLVDAVYSEKPDGSPITEKERNMYCVTALAWMFDDAAITAIPLAHTAAEAEALAVQHLHLT